MTTTKTDGLPWTQVGEKTIRGTVWSWGRWLELRQGGNTLLRLEFVGPETAQRWLRNEGTKTVGFCLTEEQNNEGTKTDVTRAIRHAPVDIKQGLLRVEWQ